jgi:Domain of unknown function (DUF6458)
MCPAPADRVRTGMRIGSSIGLIAVGLILALAVRVRVGFIDLTLVGWILTAVGVVGLIASLAIARHSRLVVSRRGYPPDDDIRY